MRWENVKALGVGALAASVALGVAFALRSSTQLPYEHRASSRWGEIVKGGKAKTPVVVAEFHGKSGLEPPFKEAVENSLSELDRTSCGLVKMTVKWDFEPTQRGMLRGDNVVMSVNSLVFKAAFDEEDGDLLGLTQAAGAKWIFLVTDRIDNPETADWVAAHEFGHAVGLEHVQLGQMQANAPQFPYSAAEWQSDDLREFCRVWSCDVAMFDDCRER